jgi:hypothetical protein
MQLGTRWISGDVPPASVPEALRAQIAAVDEMEAAAGEPRPRWTLTFLERRPIAELDTGVIVEQTSSGEVIVRHDDDDEFA